MERPATCQPPLAIARVGGWGQTYAGGFGWWNNGNPTVSDAVDVYDTLADEWSIEHLSVARRNVTATAIGGIAYFAGGRTAIGSSDHLDIYDPASGTWTTATIPASGNFHGGVANQKLLLWSNENCHIFNTLDGTWESVSFTFSRGFARSVVATPEEVWFIGGTELLGVIDIYNIADGTWRSEALAVPRSSASAFYRNGKIFIAGGVSSNALNTVETYDTEAGQWLEMAEMSGPARYSPTSGDFQIPIINSKVFFPGGAYRTPQSFWNPLPIMDIYTDTIGTVSGLFTPVLKNINLHIFPSPFSETLQVEIDFDKPTSGTIEVYDLAGQLVFLEKIERQTVWGETLYTPGWAQGTYLLKVRTEDGVAIRKILKQ